MEKKTPKETRGRKPKETQARTYRIQSRVTIKTGKILERIVKKLQNQGNGKASMSDAITASAIHYNQQTSIF